MKNLIEKTPEQVRRAILYGNKKINAKVDNIIVCGMGASGISGDILRDLVKDKVVIVNKDYNIPEYVDEKTLAFIISYSGTTEEVLNAYGKIKKKTKNIVIITSGGKLGDEKEAIIIPTVVPSRYGLPYLFFPILKILEKSRIIGRQDKAIKETIRVMKTLDKKQTSKLAVSIKNKTPIICVPHKYESVGTRWRQQFNENSKIQAISLTFPELDHNTLEGYHNAKKFELIIIRHKDETKKERRRIEITEKILQDKVGISEVWMRGKSDLAKMFYTIYFGDYMTYQLGLIENVNPYENRLILYLKKQLKKQLR